MTLFWTLYALYWGALIGVNIGLYEERVRDAIVTWYWEWHHTHHAPSYAISDATASAMVDAMREAFAVLPTAEEAAEAFRQIGKAM